MLQEDEEFNQIHVVLDLDILDVSAVTEMVLMFCWPLWPTEWRWYDGLCCMCVVFYFRTSLMLLKSRHHLMNWKYCVVLYMMSCSLLNNRYYFCHAMINGNMYYCICAIYHWMCFGKTDSLQIVWLMEVCVIVWCSSILAMVCVLCGVFCCCMGMKLQIHMGWFVDNNCLHRNFLTVLWEG